jgi:hypothetical protein
MPSPPIQTYHCICTSLLLTTTHTLSSLPRRKPLDSSSSISDAAIILPLPSSPPVLDLNKDTSQEKEAAYPTQGYTILLNLHPDRKASIIRREDGFEKRLLYRCGRCRLVIGYEIVPTTQPASSSSGGGQGQGGQPMDIDGGSGENEKEKGLEREEEAEKKGEYTGKVIYILPAGVMSTEVMVAGGKVEGRRIEEGDLGISGRAIGVFE